jgi:hypothetical protein
MKSNKLHLRIPFDYIRYTKYDGADLSKKPKKPLIRIIPVKKGNKYITPSGLISFINREESLFYYINIEVRKKDGEFKNLVSTNTRKEYEKQFA